MKTLSNASAQSHRCASTQSSRTQGLDDTQSLATIKKSETTQSVTIADETKVNKVI